MRFRVHDGACVALLPGAVGTLAGHPGGLGSRYTCGCGHADCPHPTPRPAPAPEGADGADAAAPIEAPRIGHLWLDFAEDQLTEQKRAERGTLPVPEPEPEACATCAGAGLLRLQGHRGADGRLVVDGSGRPAAAGVPDVDFMAGRTPGSPPLEWADGSISGVGTGTGGAPLDFPGAAELAKGQPVAFTNIDGADDTAEFEVDPEGEGSLYADDDPEGRVPELIEAQCPHCKGSGFRPPPPPPMIPNNPLPFRAGIRADLVELVDGAGGYGA